MLNCLRLNNYIFVDVLEIDFRSGLTVFTGETGAGKSIIIDAIEIVLGDKIDKSCIQKDKDYCEITGCFNVHDKDFLKLFEFFDEELIIRRRIDSSGKSRSYINDKIVSLSLLKEISRYIVDIHGQHTHQLLLDPKEQLDIIDRFGKVFGQKIKIKELVRKRKILNDKIDDLKSRKKNTEEKFDLYKFQKEEIDSLNTYKGEDEELEKEFAVLSNAEKIADITEQVISDLNNSDDSVIYKVGKTIKNMQTLQEYHEKYKTFAQEAKACVPVFEEIVSQVSSFKDTLDFDNAKLEHVGMRITALERIKKKYKKSMEEILSYRDFIADEIKALANDEYDDSGLLEELKNLNKSIKEQAQILSYLRNKAGAELKSLIQKELKDLGMEQVVLNIKLEKRKDSSNNVIIDENGQDKCLFLIRTNIGSNFMLLEDVVSGGELSRIMLAIKSSAAKYDKVPLLIFDEIDNGLGGKASFIVGKKLFKVSREHQVICVTHMPQVAVFADNHKYVYKKVIDKKDTITYVEDIGNQDNRINELGRMLSGSNVTEVTLNHAKEFIKHADACRGTISCAR
ncbi:DNA repair protein RecN [bacterium]